MIIEQDIICDVCGETFTAVGEGNQVRCPNCHTLLETEMVYSVTCMYCRKEFVVEGDGDFVDCPYCCKRKRLRTSNYRDCNHLLDAYHGDGGLTDYYDSDMEGAPGFYGGDC